MKKRLLHSLSLGLTLLGALPCSTIAAPAPARGGGNLEALIRQYEADDNGVSRFYDLPWSEVRFERLDRLQARWQERLRQVNFERLGLEPRIDFLLLRNELQARRDRLARQQRWLDEMGELLSFRATIQSLEKARWRLEPLNPPEAASELAALPEQLKKLRERIERGRKEKTDKSPKEEKAEKTDAERKSESSGSDQEHTPKRDEPREQPVPLKVSPVLARRTADAVNDLRGTLRTWFNSYDGFQPDFSWWVKRPSEEALKALEEYAKFLREEVAGLKGKDDDPLLGEAIGADRLEQDLAAEFIAYTPDELIAIGEREFAWCEAEMKKAAHALDLGDDWKAALKRVKAQYVPPGGQGEVIAQAAREAIQFVKKHDLVTVPALCEETWRLTMLSPDAQRNIPYAAYGGQSILVAYAREDMKHEDKLMSMRGNNRHFTRIVTAHELIPGHHLQAFSSARHRPYRSTFSTPFYVEGWPLYWEMRLWDLGYGQTPEDRIGMLFWRMHRSARIIVSLKFHLGRMKPEEMVKFLVERVGHEKFGATSEVRRFISGGYGALYQCAYTIGGMQLRALHQELVASGKMTDRQFNDEVLASGPIPIDLIRARLAQKSLPSDYQASWKFAEEKSDESQRAKE